MKSISFEIKIPGQKTQKAAFDLPESWNEVKAADYPVLASLYMADEKRMDKYDKTVRVFALLAFEAWDTIKILTPEELFDLLPLVDWVFNRLDLTNNLQPVINIDGIDYIGPCDEMENLRFAEWCAADTFMSNYAESEDMLQLHQLAAVLYRPAGIGDEFAPAHSLYRGDSRERFNDHLIKTRAALMATLPEKVIYGIFLFYASCRKQIIIGYPNVFLESKKKKPEDPGNGWLDVYDDLRSDPKYVGLDRLDEEMLHSVLFSLERSNIKMKEIKANHDI